MRPIQIIYAIVFFASFVSVIIVQSFFEDEGKGLFLYKNRLHCYFFRFLLFLKVIFLFWATLYGFSNIFLGDSSIVIQYFILKIESLFFLDPIDLMVYTYCYIRYLKFIYILAEYHHRGQIFCLLFIPIGIVFFFQNYIF